MSDELLPGPDGYYRGLIIRREAVREELRERCLGEFIKDVAWAVSRWTVEMGDDPGLDLLKLELGISERPRFRDDDPYGYRAHLRSRDRDVAAALLRTRLCETTRVDAAL